jgi:hypothetical protein
MCLLGVWNQSILGCQRPRCRMRTASASSPLPPHGRIDCALCFPSAPPWGGAYSRHGWRLERNPCAWGSRDPVVLVLGFSKGVNQTRGIVEAEGTAYDDIPFRNMRPNLTKILQRLSLLRPGDTIGHHINAGEPNFGFGSLIRCSVSKLDEATGRYLKSGDIIHALAHQPDQDFLGRCVHRFLARLPDRLRLVIMLSNDDTYVDACAEAIARVHPALLRVNPVAYRTHGVTWVHVVHPSGASGKHIPMWLEATSGKQAAKREWAIAAVNDSGGLLK